MKYVLTITKVVLFLLLSPSPVFAQGDTNEWDILNQEVMELYRTGKYDRAIVVAKKALEVAETNDRPNHPDVVTSLNNLANIFIIQGQYEQTEPLYKRAITIKEKALGLDHPDVATSLNHLALLYYSQGQREQAEPLYKRALTIREKALGPNHPLVTSSLNSLASLYNTQGQPTQAKPLYKRSIAIGGSLKPHPDAIPFVYDAEIDVTALGSNIFESIEFTSKRCNFILRNRTGKTCKPDVTIYVLNKDGVILDMVNERWVFSYFEEEEKYSASESMYLGMPQALKYSTHRHDFDLNPAYFVLNVRVE